VAEFVDDRPSDLRDWAAKKEEETKETSAARHNILLAVSQLAGGRPLLTKKSFTKK